MSARRLSTALAISIAAIMLLGSLGLVGVLAPAAPAGAAPAAVTSSPSTPAPAAFTSAASAAPTVVSGKSADLGESALALSQKEGIPSTDVYIPSALSSAGTPSAGAPVTPLYSTAPAPMGLADYGLTNTTGTVVPSVTDSTSLYGTFSTNSTEGVQPFYLDNGVPDAYSVQLNSVLTNVTLQGSNSTEGIPNQFWTQNVLEYAANLHQLTFIDNVWSFWPGFAPNTFAAYGENGTYVYPDYYYATGPTINISYPFTVGLYLNSTVINGDNAVFFNYTLSNSTMTISGSYDYVEFDSGGSVTPGEAQYQANGYQYNPLGLTNDFEIMIGGPGGGSQTDFNYIDANMTLAYWDASANAYVPITSAYNYAGETGETSSGANVWYTGTTAHLTSGPSILEGLWNATGTPAGNPGFNVIHVDVHPTNAFIFLEPWATYSNNNSTDAGVQWAPTIGITSPGAGWLANIIPVMPGDYVVGVLLEGYIYNISERNLTAGSVTLDVTLVASENDSGYTPLYLWNNAQLPAVSSGGNGTINDPYVIADQMYGNESLIDLFGQLNDYFFPVFAGAYFTGITAFVNFTAPSYFIEYPNYLQFALTYYGLPITNNLQIWISNSTHIALTNSSAISGWFFEDNSWADPANVMVWNSGDVLIANNTFDVSAVGLFIYNGHDGYPGGGITVWGNTFVNDPYFTFVCPWCSVDLSYLGIQLAANGDLLYNNVVATSVPAWTPNFDYWTIETVYSSITYTDTWNISEQSASNVNYDTDFPWYPLSGSIVGTSYQGGNYWGNYGVFPNSFNVLPYDNSLLIENGGDYVPLVPFTLYPVAVSVSGAPSGTGWSVSTYDLFGNQYYLSPGVNDQNFTVWLPNGTYESVGSVSTFTNFPSFFSVNGGPANVSVTFPALYLVTFSATGAQNTTTAWFVQVTWLNASEQFSNSTSAGDAITFLLPTGAYEYVTYADSDSVAIPDNYGSFGINTTGLNIPVAFVAVYTVTFQPVDLPGDLWWILDFGPGNGSAYAEGSVNITGLYVNGTYTVGYASESPLYLPYDGCWGNNFQPVTFTVSGANLTIDVQFTQLNPVTFTETGLPYYDAWNVTVNGTVQWESAAWSIQFLLANGTYNFTVATPDVLFTPTPASGSVIVDGAALNVSITFATAAVYTATFVETGLPNGTAWLAVLGGEVAWSNTTSITYTLPGPGSYGYAITSTNASLQADPSTGTLVTYGASTTVNVTFAVPIPVEVAYFTASGIYGGQIWILSIVGVNFTESQPTTFVFLSPGSYNYTITPPTGYTGTGLSGTVTIDSSWVSIGVTFVPITYTVSFAEVGLPGATTWAVELGGVLLGGSGSAINFSVAPGPYYFQVGYISGWAPDNASGWILVTNTTVSVTITFTAVPVEVPAASPATGDLLAAGVNRA